MFVPILLFIIGLALLIKGGDWFVDGASGIARRFHVSELLIGATIVSIGTTLPEVMVSTTSAFEGHGQLAYGNAIGSVICNTALISAITMSIKPGKTSKKGLLLPIIFFFSSAAFCAVMAYSKRYFSRIMGIILLLIFVIYTVVSILSMRNNRQDIEEADDVPEANTEDEKPPRNKFEAFLKSDSIGILIILLVLGAAAIALGARLLVNNGIKIAEALGVPETVIALTFIALGTSLPELATAITSLVKGHSNLSLGNVIGANLFNIVLVLGVSATVNPFAVPESTTLFGLPSSFVLDLPLMFAVMLLLSVPTLVKGKTFRFQGIILLLMYAAFCTLQFVM